MTTEIHAGGQRKSPGRLLVAARTVRALLGPPAQYGMSYPKSGRTWLRAMIGHVLCGRTGLAQKHLLNTRRLTAAAGLPPLKWHHGGGTLKSHAVRHDQLVFDRQTFAGKSVLFVLRDPRDTLVSAYYQATKRDHSFHGDLASFVRSSERGIPKWIAYHNTWHANRDLLAAFHVVTYESLHADPVAALRRALEAIGLLDADEEELRAAVEFARFDNLRRIEASAAVAGGALRPADQADPNSFKVRQGRVGGYRESLSAAEITFIDEALERTPCPLYQAYYRPATAPVSAP